MQQLVCFVRVRFAFNPRSRAQTVTCQSAVGAQAAKGVREKEAKVQRELETGPRPPEDPVAHQLQEIEVPPTPAALTCGLTAVQIACAP